MSDVELFWNAASAKFGVNVPYNALHPVMQMQLVEGINVILNVIGQVQQMQQQGNQQ